MTHWIDEIEKRIPSLSVRARNVIKQNVAHYALFLEMSPERIQTLKNCGEKTVAELVSLQRQLLRNPPILQRDLFEDGSTANTQSDWSTDLPKPVENLLVNHGMQITNPDGWDLEELLRSTNPRSVPLKILADIKVDHWCKVTGYERRNSADLELSYFEFRDLPFSARLCGWEINEAKKRVRPLIAAVERVRSKNPVSLQDEIDLLLPDDPRARLVAIRRALPWGDTLEELGEKEGVTRERIRQIEVKAIKFAHNLARAGHEKLGRLIEFSQAILKVGSDLSRKTLTRMIREKGADPEATIAVVSIIGRNTDIPELLLPVTDAVDVIIALPEDHEETIYQHQIANDVADETARQLRRVSRNAGAVHIDFAKGRLGLSNERDAEAVLRELGFSRIHGGWYANLIESSDRKNPIANSAGKIIGVSGPTQLSVIWEGTARHARRLKHTLAPPSVIKIILKNAGFSIDTDDYVDGNGQPYELSGAEVVYVDAIERRFNGCASFWDLYEAIVITGKYSLPTLSTVLLRTSPITEIISTQGRTTLYGIRGRTVDESAIFQAQLRQPDNASDATLSHSLVGFVINSTVTTWMMTTGVLTLPSRTELPEESWDWSTDLETGTAVTSETFLYGFSAAMRDLDVSLGDRVEFSFDVAKRHIQIRTEQGARDEKC